MSSVFISALDFLYLTLQTSVSSIDKTLIVYDAFSFVDFMTTQIAAITEINVIVIAEAHNYDLIKRCEAAQVFDHKNFSIVENVVKSRLDESIRICRDLRRHLHPRDVRPRPRHPREAGRWRCTSHRN